MEPNPSDRALQNATPSVALPDGGGGEGRANVLQGGAARLMARAIMGIFG